MLETDSSRVPDGESALKVCDTNTAQTVTLCLPSNKHKSTNIMAKNIFQSKEMCMSSAA